MYPLAYRICKIQDADNDEEMRVAYANKACEQLFGFIYFSSSTYWGWSVLKNTMYLPWYLGGPANGSIENIVLDTIFIKYS